jgi:nicotinamidase-related amidase
MSHAEGLTALVIVDDSTGSAQAELLDAAREHHLVIVHVHASEAGITQRSADEHLVVTHGGNALNGSTLGVLLRAAGVVTLVLAGDDREFAVVALARDAQAHGYRVVLAREAIVEAHTLPFAAMIGNAQLIATWQRIGRADLIRHAHLDASLLRGIGERVAPAHTALLLIDVQNDFCNPAGANGRRDSAMSRISAASLRIPKLLERARSAGCAIVHVGAEYGRHVRNTGSPYRFPSERTRDGAVWTASAAIIDPERQFASGDVEVCLPESWGRAFIDAVTPAPGEIVVKKHRFSAFTGTPLETILRARGVRTLVVVGVITNCCVESTVRDAAMLDFNVVVPSDCVGVKDAQAHLHDASLEQIYTYFGIVTNADEIERAWLGEAAMA